MITGNEDGVKHSAMSLLYSLQHIGYVIPPQADAGWIGEIDWAPNGRPGETFLPSWLNIKFQAQYVAYTRFNGTSSDASANNNLYLLAWWAVPLNGGMAFI